MYQICLRNILLFMMLSTIGSMAFISPNAVALTAEEKQAKKDNKNIGLFEKELKIGQAKLEEKFGGKNALKAFKKASRYYKKLSDTAKSSPQMSSLKIQLDALTNKAEEKTKEDKIIKRDLKYLKTTTVSLKKVEGYIEANSISSARRSLNSATTSFKKISETSLQLEEFINTKISLDNLISEVETAESQSEDKRQLASTVLFSAADFRTYVARNKILALLARGANVTELNQPADSRELKEAYEVVNFEVLEKSFREKYASLIKNQPDLAKSDGFTPNMILEIFKKRVEFRDDFVVHNGKNHFNWKIDMLKEADDHLNDKGFLLLSIPGLLDELYGNKANEPFSEITEMKKYYDWTGQSLPKDEVNMLAKYKKTLRDSLKKAAEKHEWNASKYPYKNDRIEKLAAEICEKDNASLIEVGVTGENDWGIEKNVLDIPKFRYTSGLALCQHPDEPFKRGYDVGFSGTFNGVGYEPVSTGYKRGFIMTPYYE